MVFPVFFDGRTVVPRLSGVPHFRASLGGNSEMFPAVVPRVSEILFPWFQEKPELFPDTFPAHSLAVNDSICLSLLGKQLIYQ